MPNSMAKFLGKKTSDEAAETSTETEEDRQRRLAEEELERQKQKAEEYFERMQSTREKLQEVYNNPTNLYGVNAVKQSADEEATAEDGLGQDETKFERACLPPNGTPLYDYLQSIQDQFRDKKGKYYDGATNGTMWIPPSDPLCKGVGQSGNPKAWYTGSCWVYIWLLSFEWC